MPFSQPSSGGDAFKPAEYLGKLCIFYPLEMREGIVTSFGPADAIAVNIAVVDAPTGPETFENSLLFQKALIGALRGNIGKDPVLGRLGQGVAKPGQSAPYIIQAFTDADSTTAEAYLKSVGGNPFQGKPAFSAPVGADTATGEINTPAPAAPQQLDVNNPAVQALLAQLQGQPTG